MSDRGVLADLPLRDADGRPRTLGELRGEVVVLVVLRHLG